MLGGDTDWVGRGVALPGFTSELNPAPRASRSARGKLSRFGEDPRAAFDSRARHRGAC